jgi:signal transduction histidine kinase/HPt (histidine-containing phosphotransfer) domain-containing protein
MARALEDHCYETVSVPALNHLRLTRRATLASLGQAPSATRLAEWFEILLSVQRSAVGSAEFYMETARALVEVVGLDRGLVLLREGNGWKRVAGHAVDEERGLNYSTAIVSLVAQQARTFYGNPQGLSIRSSLARVEALVASPVLDEHGGVVGILYGSRDFAPGSSRAEIQPLEAQVVQMLASSVSAGLIRLRMQDRVKQVEQLAAVGQAIGYIVHDLRGPLGNAQQLLEMLRDASASTMSREEQLDFIGASLAACRQLLNDSLEFCRGRVGVMPVRGRFLGLFQRHLELLRMDLEPMHVALGIDVPEDLVVALDPDRMARVLRNLAKNAAEACQGRPAARVVIGGRATAGGIELWVEDNGPGLPPEVQGNLFQPFATHGKCGGTGFGLAIARQLVEAHEGRIAVASNANGTRFTMTFPAAAGCVKSASAESASPTPTKSVCASAADAPGQCPLRILLAEDGAVNQRLAVALLEKWHHSVTVVANGREAIAALEAQPFDLVLMDVEMPEMDGLEATALVRQKEKLKGGRVTIVAMTANVMEGDRQRCLSAGMDDYVSKPIDPAELGRVIAAISAQKMTVDFDVAQRRIPGGWDNVRQCALLLVEECPTLLREIRSGIDRGDAKQVQRGAHTLKGTADVFGAQRVVDAALHLETTARGGSLQGAGEALTALEHQVALLCEAVRAALAGVKEEHARP